MLLVSGTSGKRAFTLVEALVAVGLVALIGVAVYGASVRGAQESAWEAERVTAEALAGELAEYYAGLAPCEVARRPEVASAEAEWSAAREAQLDRMAALALPGGSGVGAALARMRRDLGLARAVFRDRGAGTLVCRVTWSSRAGQQARAERVLPLDCSRCP